MAYVRPSKSLAEVDARAVMKKMKDKAFARAVNREDIVQGAAELGLPLEEHISLRRRRLTGDRARIGALAA